MYNFWRDWVYMKLDIQSKFNWCIFFQPHEYILWYCEWRRWTIIDIAVKRDRGEWARELVPYASIHKRLDVTDNFMRDCAAAESHALEENSYRRIHISQHWFLGATFHNGSYVHSGRKKRQWWKRWKTAARIRISTRFMTIEVLSWSEVLGHLTFHLIVATISSAISTKNRDCSPQAETTWPVCQVGLGRVLLTANEIPTSPWTRFRHYAG